MGTLTTYQIEIDENGNQYTPCQGHTYNGVILGEPVEIDGDPNTMEFNDSMFPNGTCEVINDELVVTVSEDN